MDKKRGVGMLLMIAAGIIVISNNRTTGYIVGEGYAPALGGAAIAIFIIGLILVSRGHKKEKNDRDDPKLHYVVGDRFDRKMARLKKNEGN